MRLNNYGLDLSHPREMWPRGMRTEQHERLGELRLAIMTPAENDAHG